MGSDNLLHLFLVPFPAQGHVNPLLRLGKRLASKGFLVTFTAPDIVGNKMRTANINISADLTPIGDGFIRFEFFHDGWNDDDPRRYDLNQYMQQLELVGRQVIPLMIKTNAEQKRTVSCIISNPFIPWVCDVAESLALPSALLWVQSCACFAAYYHYYHDLIPFPTEADPEIDVQLPCMPLLKYHEVPTFMHHSTVYPFLTRMIIDQFENLDKPFGIFMETFQELELEVIDYMSKIFPIRTIGPLFKNQNENVTGDLLTPDDCLEWLDSKPPSSVVYISFGSIVKLVQEQVNEIAHGLLNSCLFFLWVMRPPPRRISGDEPVVLPDGFLEKVGEKGKIVKWSPQEKVLAHPSISCFLTHCGWNSSMESLSSGVPIVAFPQWGDQVTNAKYLEEVFKIGIRVSRGENNGDWIKRIVSREEIEKCLIQATSGPAAVELKNNALKWKKEAEAAVADGGSSHKNIQAFVDELKRRCVGVASIPATSRDESAATKATVVGEELVNESTGI